MNTSINDASYNIWDCNKTDIVSLNTASKTTNNLLVKSNYNIWFMNLLEETVHYVFVNSDLSDLFEKVKWCRENDEECKKIIISEKYFKIIKEKKLIIKDYFINLNDEENLFAETDLVWLCYEGGSEGSSGVLEIAIDNIKPVIFYDKGLINNICRTHKL